jgi:3'-phosphoadenosine 5'-phosphosulfate sulfotransferase (PAPS reductase)/FAD synthetase
MRNERLPAPPVELFIDHDPLNPHPEEPTPIDLVMRLTRPQRELRVERLIEMAWQRYHEAVDYFITRDGLHQSSTCLLFSGGKDSSTIAALFRPVVTHILHANTGTGIEATRTFVRDIAHEWGVDLVMERGDDDYFDMVLGRLRAKDGTLVWPGGFPGPGSHGFPMYQRLKERAFDKMKHTLGVSNSRKLRSVWIAGRRRPESKARGTIPHCERDGPIVWVSPLAVWHKADLLALRLMRDDVPINPVADKLGMSGECGCLANAHPGEREIWFDAYPNEPFLLRILETEHILRTDPKYAHIPDYMKSWGWGAYKEDVRRSDPGRLCGPDCGPDPLLDMMDPLFDLDVA